MMELLASKSKYSTHDIGWRYLDTAISGDLNGDGINEAILLDENLENLVSFQLLEKDDDSGFIVHEVWSLPLAGKLSSNVAAVSYSHEIQSGIALAAASGKKMRIWLSPSPEDSTASFTSTASTLPVLTTTATSMSSSASVTSSTDTTSTSLPTTGATKDLTPGGIGTSSTLIMTSSTTSNMGSIATIALMDHMLQMISWK
jgi:hypothetical protein